MKNPKDLLLKSGLPLEFVVNKYLQTKGCVGKFEYSYIKPDEDQRLKEFSYDIDAAYIKDKGFANLMVECKYRGPGTKWFFLPDIYGGPEEFYPTSFIHPFDHFNSENKFLFNEYFFPDPFAPVVSKGVEITQTDSNEYSLIKAYSQLSYAMAEQIVAAAEHSIERVLGPSEFIFYHIPIIITTADLFRINDSISLEDFEGDRPFEEFATREKSLIVKRPIGPQLQNYNKEIFNEFLRSSNYSGLNERLNSFNSDPSFVLDVIEKDLCPSAFLVIQYTHDNTEIDRFFSWLDRILTKDPELLRAMQEKIEENIRRFQSLAKKNTNGA